MRKYLLLSLAVITAFAASAQDFSNKGKDFWVGYGYHANMNAGGGGSQNMLLYFATDQVTTVTVSIPGLGYSVTYPNIPANTTYAIPTPMPKTGVFDSRLLAESLAPENKGIHITSDKAIIAYAHVYDGSVSGATILYPTNTLGKEYYSVNYDNYSNSSNANCWMYVIASDTGTTVVEITPSVQTINHAAGVPFTVSLTQGQVYNLMATYTNGSNVGGDLTGSKIKSLASGTGGCKRIAVFSGSGRINIVCPSGPSGSSSDNYMVQALPKTAWSKNYLVVPTAGYNNVATGLPYAYNTYRICVLDNKTVVKLDGVVIPAGTLINNFYYNVSATNVPHKIEADLPIMVSQYLPSRANCGNPGPAGDGDPEVIYLSPVEQSINAVRWLACRNSAINQNKHYINVIIPNGGTALSSLKLDGIPVSPANFTVHPQAPGYSYAVLNVAGSNAAPGVSHYLESDSGFNAIAYGYGSAESYGYNAGTNIKDLTQQLELETAYGNETTPSVCTNSSFKFKFYYPDSTNTAIPTAIRFDSLRWKVTSTSTVMPNNFPILQINPTIDSTNIRNGRQVNWYSLPTTYFYAAAGFDTVTVTTYSSTNEGCGTTQDYEFPVQISDPPVPNFTWTAGNCVAEPYQFTETTPQVPKPTYQWWWNFGDPGSGANNTSNLRNPLHTFSAPGTYTVKYAAITSPGCLTDTVVQQVIVAPLPTAIIDGTNTVCINGAPQNIIFTGSAAGPYTFYYHTNLGGPFNVTSVGSTATIVHNPTTAGVFTYTLDSVKITGSSLCVSPLINGQQVTITVTPDATLTLTSAAGTNSQTVCINNPITNITYAVGGSGTGGSVSGLPAGVTGVYAGGVVTISGTPTAAGTYPYTVSTTGPCVIPTAAGTITVTADATLNLTSAAGTDNQTICINTPLTNITYAVGGSGTGGSVTGLPTGVTGTYAGGVITIFGTPTVAGTFNYTVNTTGPCVKPTTTGTITVTPNSTLSLSSAPGTNTQTVCINNAIANITYAVGGSGTGASITAGGLPAGVTGVFAGGVFTISGTPTASGVFNYTVGTAGPCVNPTLSGTITVNANSTIALSSAAGTDNQTKCINTSITNITYAIGGGGTGASITAGALPTGVTGVYAGGVFTISGTPTVAGTFNYTVGTAGPCINNSLSGTITVTPNSTLSLSSAPGTNTQTVCINNAIANITYAVGGSGTGASITAGGLPAGVTGVFAAGVFTISGTPTASGVFNYTVGTSGPCVNPTLSGTITVNANSTIALSSGAGTDNQTKCINTSITNITYAIGGGGTGASITAGALPAGVTGVYAGGVFTISGTPTVAGTFNYTVGTAGPCINNSLSGTITVTPNSTLSLSSAPGTNTQTVCINNAIANITYAIGGSGTGASITAGGLPAGVTGVFAGGVFTISGTPTASGVFNYTVGTAGPCVNPTLSGTITVNANSTIALSSGAGTDNQTKCINTSITNITYAIGGGGTGASITAGALPTGVTGVYAGGVFTISGTPTVAGTFNYTVGTAGPCINNSLSGTITVTPNSTLSLSSAPGTNTQTVCINNAIANITYAIGGSGTGASITAGGLPAGVTGVFAGGVFTISGTPTASGVFNYTVGTSGPCVNPTLSGTITVNANSTIALSSLPGSDGQTVCINTPINAISYTIGGGGTGASITAGSLPAGVTGVFAGGVFTITGTPTVNGTFNYTVGTAGPCINNSLSGTITINPFPTASITGNTEVCQNDPVWPGVTFTGASGTAPYTFTYSVNGGPAQMVTTTVGNSVTVQQSTAVANTFTYTLLNVQDGSVTACSQPQNGNVTIKVNPLPTAGISGSRLVCINSTPPDITFTGSGGTTPYTFTYRINGGAPQVISTTGTNTSVTLPASTSVAGSFNYILMSVQDGSSTACIQAQAGNAVIDVSDVFPVSNFSFSGPVCIPNAVVQFQNLSNIANGTPLTYLWNFGDGPATSTAVNPSHQYLFATTFNVTLEATSNAGCKTTRIIPVNNIHPQPKADFSFSNPAGVCIGDNVTLTDLSDGKDGIINQWHWDMGDGNILNTNPVSYTYSDTLTYPVTLYTVNSFGCNSDTITKQFVVHPYPKVDAGPDRFILEGGQITLSPVVYGKDLQFLWTPNLYLLNNTEEKVKVNKPLTDMTYTLTVTARGGCALSDDVFIKLLKFPKIPNTFTPNGDGINDTWRIDYLNTYPENRVQVFNRAGQLVFESRGYNTPWDGTIKGKPLPFDTYYYIIEPGNGRDPITGYVTIIK